MPPACPTWAAGDLSEGWDTNGGQRRAHLLRAGGTTTLVAIRPFKCRPPTNPGKGGTSRTRLRRGAVTYRFHRHLLFASPRKIIPSADACGVQGSRGSQRANREGPTFSDWMLGDSDRDI